MDSIEKRSIVLVSQTEYTFQLFDDKALHKQTSRQSLFNCSTFKKCHITDSDFSKCDFEGSIFHDTILRNTHVSSCDIRSSVFKNCSFAHCNFTLSAISDSEFINCSFVDCNLDDAILRENVFRDCTISGGSYKMATITLSRHYNCSFSNMVLGNCSFYDHIMDNCRFDQISINIDSIGRIYGLSIADLRNFKYIFLGKIYGYAPETFFRHIQEIFEKKNWKLQKCLYLYNIGEISSYEYIEAVFDTLILYVNGNIIVKRDDLIFLSNIIDKMKESRKLPLFALYIGVEKLFKCLEILKDPNYYNKEDNFREFLNKMFFAFNELLAEFANLFPDKVETDRLEDKILIKIHYDSDKEINFAEYINSFLQYGGYDNKFYCRLSEIQSGSIIEIIVGSILCVYALQILLYGVNGVIVQLTDLVSKVRVIRTKKHQKDFLSNSMKGLQIQPALFESTIGLLKNKEFGDNMKSLASILNGKEILDVSTADPETGKP